LEYGYLWPAVPEGTAADASQKCIEFGWACLVRLPGQLLEFRPDGVDLAGGSFERAGIVNCDVGTSGLFSVRKLGSTAAHNLLTRVFERALGALRVARNLLFEFAGHDDYLVEIFVGPSFEQERGFNDGNASRVSARTFGHPSVLRLDNGRMHDGVQFADAIGERGIGQACAIDFAIAIKNLPPEALDHGTVGWLAWRVQQMRQRVGLQEVGSTGGQKLTNSGLTACNTASESYA
jgi:hypothetical protein